MTQIQPPPEGTPFVVGKDVHPLWTSFLRQVQRALNSLGGKPVSPTTGLDGIPDGTTFGKVTNTGLTGNQVDLAKSGVLGRNQDNIANTANNTNLPTANVDGTRRLLAYKGAINPLGSIPPGTCSCSFSYTSTPTTVTFSWTAGTLYRPDGTTTAINSGSQQITGLTASTTYNHGIYYDEVNQTIALISGNGGVGTPAMAYTSKPAAASAQMIQNGVSTFGWFTSSTPASGSGGGGGGSGCCLQNKQEIELANGQTILASELRVGDFLTSSLGPIRVTKVRSEPWREWFKVGLSDGTDLTVAGDHRFLDPVDEQICARSLRLEQIVKGRTGFLEVVKLEVVRYPADKISIEVDTPHVYYVKGILSHNKQLC